MIYDTSARMLQYTQHNTLWWAYLSLISRVARISEDDISLDELRRQIGNYERYPEVDARKILAASPNLHVEPSSLAEVLRRMYVLYAHTGVLPMVDKPWSWEQIGAIREHRWAIMRGDIEEDATFRSWNTRDETSVPGGKQNLSIIPNVSAHLSELMRGRQYN
jgi:hypothetical protein